MPLSERTSSKRRQVRPARAPRAVRIIGGQWKRTPLVVADVEGLRPTPDRVRESVFSWLVHLSGGVLTGITALDLFAGTGALGFEAASRGAARVVLVEADRRALATLAVTQEKLRATQVEILRGDALSTALRLAASGERFDVVFLDPPFHLGWIDRMLAPVIGVLNHEGLLYVESESRFEPEKARDLDLEILRADKAGQVFYHLLRRKKRDIRGEGTRC